MAALTFANREIAHQTISLIYKRMAADQGNRFRALLRDTLPEVEDAYRQNDSDWRSHLGASIIGDECARAIWYGFRWAKKSHFDGRLLLLFNRGHLEEARFLALLRMIDCEVWAATEDGNQYRIKDHNGHYGGSLDAVVRGIPERPGEALLCEFKTHGEKSFKALLENGVRESKPRHYVQMNQYMGKYSLTTALYLAVNKNTDHLYGELLTFDPENCAYYLDRAGAIINAKVPPKRISDSPAWFQCRICSFADICHQGAPLARNCRTCCYSRPGPEGEWLCYHTERVMENGNRPESRDKELQLRACEDWTSL